MCCSQSDFAKSVFQKMGYFLILVLFYCCYTLNFNERNTTHLRFEYSFLQSDCESGAFPPTCFGEDISFGNLNTHTSLECLDRSGYRSVSLSSGYAFESTNTIQSFLSRINQTQEFGIEMWLYSPSDQPSLLSPYLSFSTVNKETYTNNASFLVETYDVFHVAYAKNAQSQLKSFYINNNNQPVEYAHFVMNFQLSTTNTHFQVIFNCFNQNSLHCSFLVICKRNQGLG